jgi:hypothetical protein
MLTVARMTPAAGSQRRPHRTDAKDNAFLNEMILPDA